MTLEELKRYIHDADVLLRPIVLFINPADENTIKEALKYTNNEDKFLVKISEGVTKGKIIAMDRKEFERYVIPEPPINLDLRKDCANCNNCRYQPEPLKMCDWMKEQPMVHKKCPRWELEQNDCKV